MRCNNAVYAVNVVIYIVVYDDIFVIFLAKIKGRCYIFVIGLRVPLWIYGNHRFC